MGDNHISIQRGKGAYGYHSKNVEVISHHRKSHMKKLLMYNHLVADTMTRKKNVSMGVRGTVGYRKEEMTPDRQIHSVKCVKEGKGKNKVLGLAHQTKEAAVSGGISQLEGQESLEDIRKISEGGNLVRERLEHSVRTSCDSIQAVRKALEKRREQARKDQISKKVIDDFKRKKAKDKAEIKQKRRTEKRKNSSELRIADLSLRKESEEVYRRQRGIKKESTVEQRITDKKEALHSNEKRRRRLSLNKRRAIRKEKPGASVRNRMFRNFMQKRKKGILLKGLGKSGNPLLKKLLVLIVQMLLSLLKVALAVVLSLILLFAPVMIIVVVMYDCPLSLFLPIYETEDSEPGVEVKDVISEERDAFKQEVEELKRTHPGCDKGKIVYDGAEGMGASNNINDMVAAYMCRYGMLSNAALINSTTRPNMIGVVRDMCQYTTEVDTQIIYHYDKDGKVTGSHTVTTLIIHVTYKGIGQMKSEYGFTGEQCEFADMIMSVLAGADLQELLRNQKPGENRPGESLDDEDIDNILDDIDNDLSKAALAFALDKVGSPYSQELRDDGTHFDCSSLVYYAWKHAGVSLGYGGVNTAAAEAQGLSVQKQTFKYKLEKLQPGDLIFWSYFSNGRYKDITHVAIYAGDGKTVQAIDEARGVQLTDIWDQNKIVMCGRPKK